MQIYLDRSPIISHVNNTLDGLTTIRPARLGSLLEREFEDKLNVHTRCYFIDISLNRWLGLRLDWVVLVYVSLVIFSTCLMKG